MAMPPTSNSVPAKAGRRMQHHRANDILPARRQGMATTLAARALVRDRQTKLKTEVGGCLRSTCMSKETLPPRATR